MHGFNVCSYNCVIAVVVDGDIVGKVWLFAPYAATAGIGPASDSSKYSDLISYDGIFMMIFGINSDEGIFQTF